MNFRQLRNWVILRKIESTEILSKQIGVPIDEIEKAFAKYPKEYEQMKKDMEENAKREKK